MIKLAQSGDNSEEFYDYHADCYSQDARDLEDLFVKAMVKNKPLVLRGEREGTRGG